MPLSEPEAGAALREARRAFEICNACRYCEGFCAVFPAMTQRREFADGDLSYLANLCHDCKGCFQACQYAPPHPFGVNLPRTLARVRLASYEAYAWPAPLAALYRRNGLALSVITAGAIALVLAFASGLGAAHLGAGAFYAVIPWAVMAGVAGLSAGFSLLALAVGAVRFWKDSGGGSAAGAAPLAQAAGEALSLRYLGGGHEGHDGCNDLDEGFSQRRRRFHHALFYGFALCFAATCVAFLYDHFLRRAAPYPLFSLPVVLGTLGGIAMVVGAAGLAVIKVATDPAPTARSVLGADYALLALLTLVAVTGLLLLGVRETGAMGAVLAIHLGCVLALFATIPYSKMVHGLYRALALLRHAIEARDPSAVAPPDRQPPRFTVTRSRGQG